ncbi:hypothetical protein, partial [Moorena sp. SIO3A5]|uniref:hypothetical protein n=1 Tax=Moorena sp. SIO3A5 TaxID=2607822 RepID=UPI002579E786
RTITVLGRQRGLGGPPHERLPWFPPLALCIKTMSNILMGSAIPIPYFRECGKTVLLKLEN